MVVVAQVTWYGLFDFNASHEWRGWGGRTSDVMDSTYQHRSIQLFIMRLKPSSGYAENAVERTDEVETADNAAIVVEEKVDTMAVEVMYQNVVKEGSSKEKVGNCSLSGNGEENCEPVPLPQNGKLTDWEARRYGSMAARLLHDVKIT